MAEKKKRIHHLAKELEVKSKAIIEKCEAEGIPIKNHMHVVSAGLEATVREWFSEGAHSTTLEESKRVDLNRVKIKKKVVKKAAEPPPAVEAAPSVAATAGAGQAVASAGTAVMEPPAVTGADQTAAPGAEPSQAAAAAADPPADGDTPVEVEAPADAAASVEAPPPAGEETEIEVQPEPPKVIGPQTVPAAAKLSGPKVIRMEKPDVVDRPRPTHRPPPRPAADRAPATGDGAGGEGRRVRGQGGQGGQGGRRVGGTPDQAARRAHPRRGARDTRQVASEKLREWKERDLLEMRDRLAQASGRGIGGLRAVDRGGRRKKGGAAHVHVQRTEIELTEPIYVRDFCRESGIGHSVLNRHIEDFVTLNSVLTQEQAELVCAEYGIELTVVKAKTGLDKLAEIFEARERKNLKPRSPIVTVLGHVDHGKTSLLDRIRKANVTAGEAGGITQHVGAYRVQVGDNWVTFLDTPGHAAFTAMRARGANMTDVVVLVVAADDGVMPTTVEAINHAKAAEATVVVALNKIDLDHDLNKIYGQLAEHGLTPSGDWGGQTDVIKTSAQTGEGIDDLLAHLSTLSEVLEIEADATVPACGTVIEAERDERIGNVAKLMVRDGTLRPGQTIVCGPAHGRVRSMKDDKGRTVKTAGPSTPVEVTGLSEVPEAGDPFYVLSNAKQAKEIAAELATARREAELVSISTPTTLETMFAYQEDGQIPELNVIIRADVQGSIDALKQELAGFPDDEVRLNVMHSGVGTVTESDLALAETSGAIVICFGVVPDPVIQKKADRSGVDIRTHRVIYDVYDEIKKALEGLLSPEEKLESRGRAEVREIFSVSKIGKAAGCMVRDGVITRNCHVRVVRDGVVVLERSALESLRRFKDDAKEVKSGLECGIRIENFDDVKPGDIIEAFEVVEIARTLQTASG